MVLATQLLFEVYVFSTARLQLRLLAWLCSVFREQITCFKISDYSVGYGSKNYLQSAYINGEQFNYVHTYVPSYALRVGDTLKHLSLAIML